MCWMLPPSMPTPTSLHYMGGVTNARRLFIKELGKELVLFLFLKRRMEGMPHLQKHTTEAIGGCGINKTKRSHHPATGGHQTGGPSEEEEVQDLPSCQRPKSQQLASVFFSFIHPFCSVQLHYRYTNSSISVLSVVWCMLCVSVTK